ncbi:DedA family protein [Solicola sp. PLA-1-18]|uniref:DedA family protein n=1 Tax=Solicola sp. PLA-1-18 TaxID=3380532 RepID=UPI003B792CFA
MTVDAGVAETITDVLTSVPAWVVLTVVFVLPLVEAALFVGLVIPGETAVLVGGVTAGAGDLPLWAVVVAAVSGAVIGDQAGYLVGRRWGRAVVSRTPVLRHRTDAVDRALAFVRRRGAMAVVLGRWVSALRALVPGVAGMSHMPRRVFTVANLVGGTVWAGSVSVVGYLAGSSLETVEANLRLFGTGSAVVVVAVLAGAWVWHRRRPILD